MASVKSYVPGVVDDQILLLSRYRQQIQELIRKGPGEGTSGDAAYWMRKVCETGCDVQFEKDTSDKMLKDLLESIKHQLAELRSLYADSSFYV